MIKLRYPLILASASPRRQELLTKLKIPFKIQTVNVNETVPEDVSPRGSALYLANLKGEAHDFLAKHHIVITADTIVIVDSSVLNKPVSNTEARAMLQQLTNRTHEVITGVSIRANNEVHSFDVLTKVSFGNLADTEIDFYVKSNNASDKAGAYGIQDWIGLIGISRIEGSYYNVMGFPVFEVYNFLKLHFSKNA